MKGVMSEKSLKVVKEMLARKERFAERRAAVTIAGTWNSEGAKTESGAAREKVDVLRKETFIERGGGSQNGWNCAQGQAQRD